jgi:hypothetical protein
MNTDDSGRNCRNVFLVHVSYCAVSRTWAFRPYSDKLGVFRVNRKDCTGEELTQFGRALSELNIDILGMRGSFCSRVR